MSFVERLEARCHATGSLLCVGLDPHTADLEAPTGDAARAFCRRLVAATRDVAAAYKPNAAFFEALGPDGVAALTDVIAEIPDEIPVILDVKRGDISSTAAAYATSAFDHLGADAVTLNAYMGADAVAPFMTEARGAFVLCRTSNPSGAELQDLALADGRRVYEAMADLVDGWDLPGHLGLVVGATVPDELEAVRRRAPGAWILAPGVGAQGADLAAALAAGLREDGLGLLVNVGRGISRADDPAEAAKRYARDIAAARDARTPKKAVHPLAEGLLRAGCVRFGEFTLKSGLKSPIYLDLRRLVADPPLLAEAARAYAAKMAELDYDVIAPLPYAAMPIGTAISLHTGEPMVYPRREVKAYGTKKVVEGVFEEGQTACIVDDLATTGGSKIEGAEKLNAVGLVTKDVVVLIDRESGAVEQLAEAGLTMHAVFTISELLTIWEDLGAVSAEQVAEVRAFLASTGS